MKATLLPDKLTPLSPDEAIAGMRGAVLKLKGKEGTPEQITVLIAQSALETGHWKSFHCFNVGNAKASPNYEGFYCQFRCNEIINGKTEWFDPPHPQTNFRAFLSAADGFADHIKLLATVLRYAKAWACAERGEAEAYSRACAAAGYYSASVETYTRSTVQLFAKYLPIVREHFAAHPTLDVEPTEDPPAPPPNPAPIAPPLDPQALPVIRRGATGDHVRLLQERLALASKGQRIVVDGSFGPRTEKFVRDFQRQRGLTADGVVGPRTWARLLSGNA